MKSTWALEPTMHKKSIVQNCKFVAGNMQLARLKKQHKTQLIVYIEFS